MANAYIPGACNIGPAEIRVRKLIGWSGVIACVALLAAFFAFDVPPFWRLTLFFPAMLAALGHLQATWQFCVAFGLSGQHNVGPNLGRTSAVDQAEFRRHDRRFVMRIIGLSLVAGTLVAGTAYMLPL